MKRRIMWITVLVLVASTVGCARQSFPKVRVESVRGFSLGSAKFTPFRRHPSAQELYKAALNLYDSFETAAATEEIFWHDIGEWSEVDGKVDSYKVDTRRDICESRAAKPGKELTVWHNAGSSVLVTNGKTRFLYFPKDNTYIKMKPWLETHSPAAGWCGLMPDDDQPFSSMRLLPDCTVAGTEVYVLELKLPSHRYQGHWTIPQTRRVYLGKTDLLPRKSETIEGRTGPDAHVPGLPNNTMVRTYLGFVANPKLPDGLFPTRPPEGARKLRG